MKILKRKPKKLIQARFIYDTSRIGVNNNYSDWQTVTEKEFQSAINTLDGWSSNQFIALGNLVRNRYDINGFEKREIE
ncbi:hypothetical protein AM4_044 [Lactococcus phage AM4]|uniref:Uncharacterized protein n=2 Tax=Audreyjarvisvirus AM4 TaxID=2845189 RepID=A0A1W6JKH0_9CAUD|nr:hypothetical protein H1Z35_gp044 [Lactococcus phage AM4]ARM66703.1 hypothetical protein AM4_044 [Lactococcus phage AM4]ARM66936.1 hypothetical protein AM5_083 [Lactococcus phage AM5]